MPGENFWTKENKKLWRFFECIFCKEEKKKWMAEEQPYGRESERPTDYRQWCSNCRKITQHKEASPPKQSE
jgi:hypothetical protein